MTVTGAPGDRRHSRNRHFPRLCVECLSPMAVQEELCWRCGAAWTADIDLIADAEPRAALRLIKGGAAEAVPLPSTAARLARLRAEARR
jgi:hypothetical protein